MSAKRQSGSGVPPLNAEDHKRRDAASTLVKAKNASRPAGSKEDGVWPVVPLGELAADERNAITDGPFGSKLKTEHYTDAGPRVIRLKNIGDADFVDAKAYISEAHLATLQKHRVFPGDVVIAALGEDPPRSCLVPEHLGPDRQGAVVAASKGNGLRLHRTSKKERRSHISRVWRKGGSVWISECV